jgi:uncharacterized Zn finger protein
MIAVGPSVGIDESPLPCPRCCTLVTERLLYSAHSESLYLCPECGHAWRKPRAQTKSDPRRI